MMPALFLPFTCLPTLPSGKANRKALVALVENMSKTEIAQYIPHDKTAEEFVDVTTDEERVMQQAWASVLDEPEEAIGANSIFLSLGGDSISAINVVAACRQLSYTISVSHILSNPTLAEQAKHLRPEQRKVTITDVEYEIPQSILSILESAGLQYGQDIEQVYPAGPGQIEFLIQGHKKEQFWNLTACRDIPKDFDLHHWKAVTTELTARNQILRTMYCQADRSDKASWYQVCQHFHMLHRI
jgi:aryl carrier-like protein